jgi:hypothetical protein
VQCDSQAIANLSQHDGRMDPLVFESCHSTWHFDTRRSRFRRVLKEDVAGGRPAATEWRRSYGLEFDPDSETFIVLLNSKGTRLLRPWRHTQVGAQCDGHAMDELSLDEPRRSVG